MRKPLIVVGTASALLLLAALVFHFRAAEKPQPPPVVETPALPPPPTGVPLLGEAVLVPRGIAIPICGGEAPLAVHLTPNGQEREDVVVDACAELSSGFGAPA